MSIKLQQHLGHNMNKHVKVWITRNRMRLLNDEDKLQFDKKSEKLLNNFENNYQKFWDL